MLISTNYKISLVYVPLSYQYNDGEIVYRIFVNNQLISERSLPTLSQNKALCDTFVVNLAEDYNFIHVHTLKNASLVLKKIVINNIDYGPSHVVRFKNCTIKYIQEKK